MVSTLMQASRISDFLIFRRAKPALLISDFAPLTSFEERTRESTSFDLTGTLTKVPGAILREEKYERVPWRGDFESAVTYTK